MEDYISEQKPPRDFHQRGLDGFDRSRIREVARSARPGRRRDAMRKRYATRVERSTANFRDQIEERVVDQVAEAVTAAEILPDISTARERARWFCVEMRR
jgi:hypothetical protein